MWTSQFLKKCKNIGVFFFTFPFLLFVYPIYLFNCFRVVCYLEDKEWLKESRKGVTNLKSLKKEYKTALNAAAAKPGCSHWEDHGKNRF